MRMVKNKKIRRIMAFVLAVVLILGTMPYSVQNVKAATVDFTIKLTDDADSTKPLETAAIKFIRGTEEYIALHDVDNTYKLSVEDSLVVGNTFNYDSLEILMDGYVTYTESTGTLLQTGTKEVPLTAKTAGMTAFYTEPSAAVKYSDLTDGSYDVGAPTVQVSADAAVNQKITYTISGGNTADVDESKRASVDENGLVYGLTYNASPYVITATVTSDNYADAAATFTLTVDKGIQNAVFTEGDNVSVTYDNTTNPNTYTNALTGVKEEAGVTYSIDADTTGSATINAQTGEVTYTKSGSITVKAQVAGTDNYEEKEYVYTLNIDKESRDDFAFASTDENVTYGENNNEFTQTVGGNGSDSAVYSVDKPDVATIDAATGKLTILKAGTVVVTASVEADDTYGSATATYTLVIGKADREITFGDNAGVIDITYNESEMYTNVAALSVGTETVKYEITADDAGIASVDNAGVVSYSGEGTIVVRAYVDDENDCYNTCEASYTLNISYANISAVEDCVEITGDKADDSNDWYKSNVTITAKTDYQLKKEQNASSWLDSISLTSDGTYSDYQVYVKNSSNEIGLITLPVIRIDTTAPVCSAVKYETPAYEKVLEMITFGFYKASTVVTLEAADAGTDVSGIKNITYTITKDDGTEETQTVTDDIDVNGQKLTYGMTVDSAYKNRIKFSASDNAGNTSDSVDDNKGVYIDSEAPVISYTFPTEQCIVDADDKVVEEAGSDTRYVYNSFVQGTITVSDIIIDIDTVSVEIKKDGAVISTLGAADFSDVTSDIDETYTCVYDFDADGVYEVTTTVRDKLGSESSSVYRMVVDATAPVVEVKYNQTDLQSQYTSEVESVIKITDDNLRISDISAAITAKDSLGANFSDLTVKVYNNNTSTEDEIKVSEFAAAITNEAYWVKAGNTWTAVVNYSNDADYRFIMSCTDIANNSSNAVDDYFILDMNKPEISVTLSNSSNVAGGVLYYDADTTASADIVIKDGHFDADKIQVTDTYNGTDVVLNQTWTQVQDNTGAVTNSWKTTVVFAQEGEHRLTVEGLDAYGNEMNEYVSDTLIKDNTKPEITVSKGTVNLVQTVGNSNYYNGSRTDTITVKEDNFDPNKVSITVMALDYTGKPVTVTDYDAYLKDAGNWTTDVSDASIHTASITFDANANYTYTVNCKDLAGQRSDVHNSDSFTVDDDAPEVYEVEYSTSVIDKLIEGITFGFYKAPVNVTITAKDSVSGIEKLEYSVSDETVPGEYIIDKTEVDSDTQGFTRTDDKVSYTFTIAPQANGKVSFTAYDYSMNSSAKADDKVIVIDDINPHVTIEYTGNLVDKVIVNEDGSIADDLVNVETQDTHYVYNGIVTATVKVDEENFFVTEDDVVFTVMRDGAVVTDYTVSGWTKNAEGKYECVLTFVTDGNYQLKITYSDKSGNVMDYEGENSSNAGTGEYTSNIFTIDDVPPVVEVNYDVNKPDEEYTQDRTATVTITDKNFRPSDISAEINAHDSIMADLADLTVKVHNYNTNADEEVKVSEFGVSIKERKYWNRAEDKWTAQIIYSNDAEYQFIMNCMDVADNVSNTINHEFSLDKTKSEVQVLVSTPSQVADSVHYYSENDVASADIIITDEHFDSSKITVKDTLKDTVETLTPAWDRVKDESGNDTNSWKATVVFDEEGSHVLSVEGTDAYGLQLDKYVSAQLVKDKTKPVISVTYDGKVPVQTVDENSYYNAARTAYITITEANFRAGDVSAVFEALDYIGEDVKFTDYSEFLKDERNWTTDAADSTKHTAVLEFDANANYVYAIDYTDLAGQQADKYESDKFTVDNEKPEELDITYSESVIDKIIEKVTFGFYKAPVDVTITAKDKTAGIDKIEYSFVGEDGVNIIDETIVDSNTKGFTRSDDKVSYTFTISPQARGKVHFTAYDYSGNSSDRLGNKVIIVDDISPEATIKYSGNLTDKVIVDKEGSITRDTVTKENQDTRYVYNGAVTATVSIDEDNFFEMEDDVKFTVTRDGKDVSDYGKTSWVKNNETGEYECVLSFAVDGDYQVQINYSDKSGNEMNYVGENDSNSSDLLGKGEYISNVFTIDTTSPVINVDYDINEDDGLYSKNRTAAITVKDRNFRPYEVNVMITSKDKDDNTVAYTAPDLTKWVNWKQSDDDENTWEAYITYDSNAVYTFDIEYQDIAKNALKEDYIQDEFSISKNAPSGLEIVEYSEPVITIWDTMLEMATFGKYHVYKDSVTVTVKVVDTDNVAGIKQIDWEYNKESGVSDINKDKLTGTINSEALTVSGNAVTGKFTLPSEAADDQLRGNITFTATSNTDVSSAKKEDTEAGIIVDGKKPVGSVEYLPSEPKTDDNDTKYYDGDVTAHITIDEANFYGKNVHVYVNDEEVHPVWSTAEEDKHNADVVLSGDGDYVIKMTYIDHSGNEMDAYTSSKIVIDTVNPVLDITYDNKNVINKVDGNDYFDSNQSAEIKITEHNFRAEDVVVDVKATDVNGNSINVQNYADYLKRESSWTTSGDVHTAKITFDVNANYIVQADFTDLAKREVSSDTDYFTVDKVNPYGLSISYSASVLDTILEAVTFGFYNTPVEVAVEASDDISPVERFEYAYDKSSGASDTNVQQINDIVRNAEISRDGSRSTTSFVIPKGTLMAGNQINGTMSFVAYDYAGNNSDLDDNEVIIVDNINPESVVTFNEPVQNYNGIAYYAGDIQATVVIEEANFYPEDVEILVTKDGSTQAVEASWSDNSADVHTGTFTLHEDGDYQVTVNYTDKSQNAMTAYTSEQMTIDTQLPAVSVSNIKSNSANKDEVYSFTITASDENFDTAGFVPELSAVLRNEAGNYTTQEISLGTIKAVDEGRTYAFTVDNLTQDAVYNLTCTVRDLSGNEYRGVLLEDGQEYENVAFSINRNGSTFSVNENTEKLLDNYYVYEVGQDVVIYEVNIDPIQTYVVKLNGKELKEGSDYTTSMTNNAGEWAVRTYTINKALFETEGEYKIIIESVDKTNTSAYSDVKNLTVAYVVDKTAPLLTVSGLENGGRYQIGEQEVTVLATDDGGRLKSFKAVVLDSEGNAITDENGNDVSVRYDMSGDDLLDYLSSSDGKITFTVPEGLEQQVVLTCDDAAVGLDGTTNKTEERFSKVTVSQSGLIILYANKPLFYGIIAGAVLLIAAGVGFVIFVGRKKAKSNN